MFYADSNLSIDFPGDGDSGNLKNIAVKNGLIFDKGQQRKWDKQDYQMFLRKQAPYDTILIIASDAMFNNKPLFYQGVSYWNYQKNVFLKLDYFSIWLVNCKVFEQKSTANKMSLYVKKQMPAGYKRVMFYDFYNDSYRFPIPLHFVKEIAEVTKYFKFNFHQKEGGYYDRH